MLQGTYIYGLSQIDGYLFGGPHDKDYNPFEGLYSGPYLRKRPYELESKLLPSPY